MALMDSMSTDDISGYREAYQEALAQVIEAKREGRKPERYSAVPRGPAACAASGACR
jgi:DNA end-binding protein Ku